MQHFRFHVVFLVGLVCPLPAPDLMFSYPEADKVHSIAPLTPLGLALTVEDNNRKLRVIALE